MKIILLSLLSLLLYGSECLNTYELGKVQKTIESFNEQYGNVPNYITCGIKKNILEKYICNNPNYRTMFKLLSVANVYAYENATKQEVDYQNFNKKHLYFKRKKYIKNGNIQYNQLCFNIKEKTTDFLGGLSPYHEISMKRKSKEEKFFVTKNRHGYILKNPKGYVIYLGEKCDVLDSHGNKGYWNKKSHNIYYINIRKKKITFYDDSNTFKCDRIF